MLKLNRQGTTIFLTTHYMEEPERFCKHIAIVDHGELKALGTNTELKALVPDSQTRHTTLDDVFVYLTGGKINPTMYDTI
jgi:ABC-2 type transport system ATP-binding protein